MMIKKDLETIVDNDLQILLQNHNLTNINFKYVKKRYIFLNYILIVLLLLIWSLLLATIFGMPISFLDQIGTIGKVFLFLVSLLIVSLAGWLIIKYYQAVKIQKIIIQQLPFEKFYKIELDALIQNQYQITEIMPKFNLFPHTRVPNCEKIKTDDVINFNENQINYSFGTLTERIVVNYDKTQEVIYTRYPYLTLDLTALPRANLIATIKAMGTFLKVFKTRDNTKLESTEFERLFAVHTNDQILVRKLLAPKIMVNLIELAGQETKIPSMHFEYGHLTIVFDHYHVSSFEDPKGRLLGFYFTGTYQDVLTNIITIIRQDIKWLLNVLQWVIAYDFKQ